MIPAKTVEDLGWDQILLHLARRTHTVRGEAAVRSIEFFDRPEDAAERSAEIGEVRALYAAEAPLGFGGIGDVGDLIDRAAKGGVLEAGELLAVADTGHGCTRLCAHIRSHGDLVPRLVGIVGAVEDLGHVYHPIRDSFDADGRLLDHASDELGSLRQRALHLRNKLENQARALVDGARMAPYLQDTYYTQREERYVLPIKVESRSFVKGIVHGSSQSGQTVFVEPDELVDLNNSLKLAEYDVADEERRIMVRLSGYIAEDAGAFHHAIEVATRLDALDAAARLAEDLEAAPVEVSEQGAIELSAVRHPLMVVAGRDCVANDITMAPRSILVVSGPNAGGKTVALKTVGLAALMARAGLHVAALPGSRMPWFRAVYTDIGDAQSLEKDLSTFSAHLLQLNQFLGSADGDSLLLIDELAVGTEPEQGAALAEAVLETLSKRRVPVMVTTHYERLKALAAAREGFANASVGFDLEAMEPTFRLHLGTPGSSGALRVARRLGLPAEVADRAELLLGEHRAGVEELLLALAEQRRQVDQEQKELASELDGARRAHRQAETALAAARSREEEAHRAAYHEAVAALRRARDELDRVRAGIKRRRAADLTEVKREISAQAGAVAAHAPAEPPPPGDVPAPEQLVPGTRVTVAGLGRGVVAAAAERGRVTVQIGNVRTTTPIAAVRLDTSRPPRAAPSRSQPRGRADSRRRGVTMVRADDEGRALARTVDTTLDVRGERVDDALSALDRYIDESLLAVREVIFVIHGHGTGALRNAIRSHLKLHGSVERWRPGEQSEGGDGVTVVWLDVN